MRIVVTGTGGQLATSLGEAGAAGRATVVLAGRPGLDLTQPESVLDSLAAARPDVIVNAAAYTQVDRAESEPELAGAINGGGAGVVAASARALGVPLIQISTDYVFDGTRREPYVETDPVCPVNVYGASKLAGEQAVAGSGCRHVILRTSWVYSPFGSNFVRTMLRLAATRDEIAVVDDQRGCPTYAPDIADAIVTIAATLCDRPRDEHSGLFNLCGSGDCTWAGFAEEIFRLSALRGGPSATVRPIPTSGYPLPARRPANSRLDCSLLARVHGVRIPDWRSSLAGCIARLTP